MCLAARLRKWGSGRDRVRLRLGLGWARARLGPGLGWDRVSLGPRPSLGLPPGRGGTGVSLTCCVLQPLGRDRCRSRSRLFEKSFSLLPGPTESPIDQPINDGYGWVVVQGPARTQASPVGETVMGELCRGCQAGGAAILTPGPTGSQCPLPSPARWLGMRMRPGSLQGGATA